MFGALKARDANPIENACIGNRQGSHFSVSNIYTNSFDTAANPNNIGNIIKLNT